MRKIYLVFFLLASIAVNGQDDSSSEFKTIFNGTGKQSVSGFGGPTLNFSAVNNNFGFSMGLQGAAIFNKSVFIGLFGETLVNFPNYKHSYYSPILGRNASIDKSIIFYQGGIYSGFILKPNNPIHIGISAKLGWGGITLIDDFSFSHGNPGFNESYAITDLVFVATPQFDLEMNVTRWFKMNMGVGYRFVTGVNESYLFQTEDGSLVEKNYFESDAFNSLTFSVGFNFGWFK
jgi:hypothetical protein